MGEKTFKVVTFITMVITFFVATLSLVGIVITGFYPGIVVFALLAVVPVISKLYAKRINNRPDNFRGNCYKVLTVVNLLAILIVLWMTFVIAIDRVLSLYAPVMPMD